MQPRHRTQILLLAVAIGASACVPPQTSGDPFTGPTTRSGRQGIRDYRIALEVACDRCLITFTVGAATQTTEAGPGQQIWRRRFTRRPMMREAIRLTASPSTEGVTPRAIRILVDGDVVAQRECACDDLGPGVGTGRETLTVEIIIPLEGAPLPSIEHPSGLR